MKTGRGEGRGDQGNVKAGERLCLRKGACSRTAFDVEDVMFVQGPATEVGRVQLEALQEGCSFLPQDEAGAGLVLKPDGH